MAANRLAVHGCLEAKNDRGNRGHFLNHQQLSTARAEVLPSHGRHLAQLATVSVRLTLSRECLASQDRGCTSETHLDQNLLAQNCSPRAYPADPR
jgi:hypothetical protein